MYKRLKLHRIVLFLVLLFSLTACTQQADSEEQNISADIVESNTDVEKVGNGSDMPQNDTVEGLNQDILAASAGTMVTQIIEISGGGIISINAQVDLEGISRVSCYKYIPMEFTEEIRRTVLEKMFPAESWDVNGAAMYNEQKNSWEFETPRKESWMYQIKDSQIPSEQIVNIERVDIALDYMRTSKISPIQILNEEDVMLFVEVTDSTPREIEQIGQGIIDSVTDANYLCNYIHICGEDSEHPYVKAVFKQTVDGMPVTVWHNFSTATSKGSPFPVKVPVNSRVIFLYQPNM